MSGSWDNTNQGLDSQIEGIISAIQNAIHASTPWVKISPCFRPGFTPKCKEAQLNAKKLKRRWRKLGTEEAWEAFREARNNKARIIKKAMKLQYRTETENACDSPIKMWKRCKWSRNRTPREACMPALHSYPSRMLESCPKAKAKILINRFFLPLPAVDLSDIETPPNYLPSYHTGKITVHEIRSIILGSISKKAPGEDGIPNLILKLFIDSLLPHLYQIFNKCLDTGFCPTHLRISITVVLRKPGKPDYTTAKAYAPLLCSIRLGKLLSLFLLKESHIWPRLMNCCLIIILVLSELDLSNMLFTICRTVRG